MHVDQKYCVSEFDNFEQVNFSISNCFQVQKIHNIINETPSKIQFFNVLTNWICTSDLLFWKYGKKTGNNENYLFNEFA